MMERVRKTLPCVTALVFVAMSPAEKNSEHTSTIAVTIDEKDLFPEGLVYDNGGECFYIGSLLKRKILKVDPAGHRTELIATGEDGLFQVLGLKVDPKRRVLWACSAAESATKKIDGYSAIFEYDLPTGKLRRKFLMDNKDGPHLFNDIAITTSGDAFFTDSRGGAVFRIQNGKDSIDTLIPLNTLVYPNGIALSSDEKILFVAHESGIDRLSLSDGTRQALSPPPDEKIGAIDGLYFYRDSLIGIQNGRTVQRVARLYLNADRTGVERLAVLDTNNPLFDIPTTGCIVGDDFFFIGNSQIDKLSDEGTIRPGSALTAIHVLKLKL